MPGQVGGDTGRLAHNGNPTHVRNHIAGVLVGALRIGVEQALNHYEMTRDVLRVGAAQIGRAHV